MFEIPRFETFEVRNFQVGNQVYVSDFFSLIRLLKIYNKKRHTHSFIIAIHFHIFFYFIQDDFLSLVYTYRKNFTLDIIRSKEIILTGGRVIVG